MPRYKREKSQIHLDQLHRYVVKGKYEKLRSLVNGGVDLNLEALDTDLLTIAAKNENWNIVELLIDCGANIYSYDDNYKWTFLHYAARFAWMPVIQMFINRGFNLEVKTAKNETPLLIAAQYGNLNVINVLISAEVNINACDSKKLTALHHATANNYQLMTVLLVCNNIRINAQDLKGCTALHHLLRRDADMELVGFLLNAGVNCNIADKKGITAFNLLTSMNAFGAIRLGIKNGACVGPSDYHIIESLPLLKSIVLTREQYCIQAILNNFNNRDVPNLYRVHVASDVLPPIEDIKITQKNDALNEIKNTVQFNIAKKGYCNIMTDVVFSLKMSCVKAFLEHVEKERVAYTFTNPTGVVTRSKRLAAEEFLSRKSLKTDG